MENLEISGYLDQYRFQNVSLLLFLVKAMSDCSLLQLYSSSSVFLNTRFTPPPPPGYFPSPHSSCTSA